MPVPQLCQQPQELPLGEVNLVSALIGTVRALTA